MIVKFLDEQGNAFYYAKESQSKFEYTRLSKIVLPLEQKPYVKQYLPEPTMKHFVKGKKVKMWLHEEINVVLRLQKEALTKPVPMAYLKQINDTIRDYQTYLVISDGDYLNRTSRTDNNRLDYVIKDLKRLNDYEAVKKARIVL